MKAVNTIILTINNKEKTIGKIIENLFSTISAYSKELIIILDGCNDSTKHIVFKNIFNCNYDINIKVIETPDIWETKANNTGLKLVKTKFATIIQDDMLIHQKHWDKLLVDYLSKKNIFAITGRSAHDFSLKNEKFSAINLVRREYPIPSDTFIGKIVGKFFVYFKPFWIYKYIKLFNIRLIANRGPLVVNMNLIRKLNYFDEEFAPFELDDADLCCRAFKKFNLLSASLPIHYTELSGSKKHNKNSQNISKKSIEKNTKILYKRHFDLAN